MRGGRRAIRQQGKQQQAQRVVISAVIHRIFIAVRSPAIGQCLFRGHRRRGANKRSGVIAVFAPQRAEIGQLEQCAILADQQIAEFQIAVDKARAMHHIQPVHNLFGPVQNLRQIGRRVLPLLLRQPLPKVGLQSFQHQHRLIVHQTMIEQRDHMAGFVGVEPIQKGDFALQMIAPMTAQGRIGLRHGFGVDKLEGDGATFRVGGRPDLAVTARAG